MASTSTSTVLQIFILAIISLFFINNSKLVVADHDLMKSQCECTEAPALCMQCLESDPESEKVDKFGITMIIVNCMSNNSQTAMSNFTNIVKTITDKDIKMAVTKNCVEKYPEVIGNVSMVNNHLKNREFDQAADALAKAIASEHYCFLGISKFKLVFPDLWIYYGIRVYDELSEGVMRMIDHFM